MVETATKPSTESLELKAKTSLPQGIVEGGRYRMPTRKDPYGLERGFVVERDYRDGGARIRREPDGKVKDVSRQDMREMAHRHQQAAKAHRRDEPESFAGDTYIYYRTIGYMARRSVFYAEGPPDLVPGFEDKCAEATGLDMPDPRAKRIHSLKKDTRQWGMETHIRFTKPPEDWGLEMDLGPDTNIRDREDGNTLEVSCNDLFLGLLAKGFRLDGSHEIAQIREGISDPEMREAFDEGMEWSEMALGEVRGIHPAAAEAA